MTPSIRLTLTPQPAETEALLEGLRTTEKPNLPKGDGYQQMALFVDSPGEAGPARTGLYGYALFDWFYVEFLHVAPEWRGQGLGTRLIEEAAAWCRIRGLVGMWLQTMDFQARGFYEKQGFTLIATHAGRPVGSATHFMERRF